MRYPIAEIFHSIQGEGAYTGTPMMFVRLAGCNVGRYCEYPMSTDQPFPFLHDSELSLLREKKHSICTSFAGERFLCDTDYHVAEHLAPMEILEQLGRYRHICITGGEPFLHDLEPLYSAAHSRAADVSIETSGTRPITSRFCWVTCSPKEGFLPANIRFIDEWKFLVGPNFQPSDILSFFANLGEAARTKNVYLQPINGVDEQDEQNLQRALETLREYPEWKLSAQLHKYIKQR